MNNNYSHHKSFVYRQWVCSISRNWGSIWHGWRDAVYSPHGSCSHSSLTICQYWVLCWRYYSILMYVLGGSCDCHVTCICVGIPGCCMGAAITGYCLNSAIWCHAKICQLLQTTQCKLYYSIKRSYQHSLWYMYSQFHLICHLIIHQQGYDNLVIIRWWIKWNWLYVWIIYMYIPCTTIKWVIRGN